MKTITRSELCNMLFNVKGAKFVTITARTIPKLIGGKSNPYHGVEKVAVVNGTINFHYENSVNRQREREGKENDFEAKERVWGKQLFTLSSNSRTNKRLIPFVIKKYSENVISEEDFAKVESKNLCLSMKVEKSVDYKYVLNGKEVDKDAMKEQIYRSGSNTQDLDKEIIVRTYDINNILNIAIDNETYAIAA